MEIVLSVERDHGQRLAESGVAQVGRFGASRKSHGHKKTRCSRELAAVAGLAPALVRRSAPRSDWRANVRSRSRTRADRLRFAAFQTTLWRRRSRRATM